MKKVILLYKDHLVILFTLMKKITIITINIIIVIDNIIILQENIIVSTEIFNSSKTILITCTNNLNHNMMISFINNHNLHQEDLTCIHQIQVITMIIVHLIIVTQI